MKPKIIPSIIAKDQKEFNKRFDKVKSYKLIQLDVMDGEFVKNKSLNFQLELPKKNYEAHLMIKTPKEWIEQNYEFVKSIIIHYESVNEDKLDELISLVKKKGRKIGLAINPKTKVQKILPYVKKVDKILILTVNPGKYGSRFLPENLKKIKEIRKESKRIKIQVDGGVNPTTLKIINKYLPNEVVIGSYLQV